MAADPAECQAFLQDNPDIAYVEVVFTGMSGVPRGKRLRRHELQAIYDYGRFLPGSVQVVDITGQDAYDTGLVWENGDADMLARPAPGWGTTWPRCCAPCTSWMEPRRTSTPGWCSPG
jgi:glutamine synthetase